jgi:hypothetical protein
MTGVADMTQAVDIASETQPGEKVIFFFIDILELTFSFQFGIVWANFSHTTKKRPRKCTP